jgi:hypothetical protein
MLGAALLLFGQVIAATPAATDLCATRQPGSTMEAFVAVAARQMGDSVVRAAVCLVAPRTGAAKIGSYHGELHFDSAAVVSTRVRRPDGGTRVENVKKGQVNFAGANPTGFAGRTLLNVELRLKSANARPALRLRMIELNSTDGANLIKQLVVSQ